RGSRRERDDRGCDVPHEHARGPDLIALATVRVERRGPDLIKAIVAVRVRDLRQRTGDGVVGAVAPMDRPGLDRGTGRIIQRQRVRRAFVDRPVSRDRTRVRYRHVLRDWTIISTVFIACYDR